jgi:hypothetical protein
MGFANIWATKQECNGKGQRRWCVSFTGRRGRLPGRHPTGFGDAIVFVFAHVPYRSALPVHPRCRFLRRIPAAIEP